MPTGHRFSENDIDALKNRTVFFDANIFIFLFFSPVQKYKEKKYSAIYKKLLNNNNISLATDSTIVSEVINRALRIQYRLQYPEGEINFKTYRNSPDGQTALTDIHGIIDENILPRFSIDGRTYTKAEVSKMLVVDELDFNDKLINLLCEEKNYVLLTDDGDFKNSSVDTLSDNKFS